MTLTEFLLARIAEDEAAAQAAMNPRGTAVYVDGPAAEHYSRHDPARVLAQCAAYRRILVSNRWADTVNWSNAPDDLRMQWEHSHDTLRALATIWVDDPTYEPDWRPI